MLGVWKKKKKKKKQILYHILCMVQNCLLKRLLTPVKVLHPAPLLWSLVRETQSRSTIELSWALQMCPDRSPCSLWVICSERSSNSDKMYQGTSHTCRRLFTVSLLDTLLKFLQSPVLKLASFILPLSVCERVLSVLFFYHEGVTKLR